MATGAPAAYRDHCSVRCRAEPQGLITISLHLTTENPRGERGVFWSSRASECWRSCRHLTHWRLHSLCKGLQLAAACAQQMHIASRASCCSLLLWAAQRNQLDLLTAQLDLKFIAG
jgi:hypothetical protein